MQTKTKYEEMVLRELRDIPDESLPQVIKILRSLKESIRAARRSGKEEPEGSGLCGVWQDERGPEEIVRDIYSHRTGFGGRGVAL